MRHDGKISHRGETFGRGVAEVTMIEVSQLEKTGNYSSSAFRSKLAGGIVFS